MAVDRKIGKPVPDLPLLPDGRAFAEYLAAVGALTDAQADDFARAVADFARAAADDADPRGVSPLRGAYGPWLAARETRKVAEGRP